MADVFDDILAMFGVRRVEPVQSMFALFPPPTALSPAPTEESKTMADEKFDPYDRAQHSGATSLLVFEYFDQGQRRVYLDEKYTGPAGGLDILYATRLAEYCRNDMWHVMSSEDEGPNEPFARKWFTAASVDPRFAYYVVVNFTTDYIPF